MSHVLRISVLAGCFALAVLGGMRIQADHDRTSYAVSPAGDLISTEGETVTTFCILRGHVYAIADASCAVVRSASIGKGELR